ncbi:MULTISPECIES: hypothetical protein [Luteimonas]|uniref:hypothetical protein n=1 Tax=Luteimonas TaxID=83614 RepID=UPI000C7AA2F4|nr:MULTISPECIES: hypothetical protein [Luteimonas]
MRAGAGTRLGLGAAGGAAVWAWLSDPVESRRSIEWAWTFLLTLIEEGPISLWAVVLAVLAGWLVTLRVGMLPMRCLSPSAHAVVAQLAGAVASFTVVFLLWREPIGLIIGALVGLSAPYTWTLILILLELCPAAWASRWAVELRGEGRQLELPMRRRRR